MEFIFAPASSAFAVGSAAPGMLPADRNDPELLPPWLFDCNWDIASRSKLFKPDGTPHEYGGWSFKEEVEEVCFSDRGWRRCIPMIWLS